MYYIRKTSNDLVVHNRTTRKSRFLNPEEAALLLQEFPSLQLSGSMSQSTTLFKNQILSISNLP